MIEIRWHARAGQGAKTAAQLLAEALLRTGKSVQAFPSTGPSAEARLRTGKSVQAFPEYGPERRGAPVRAYTRVSDTPIRRHDSIAEPDVVVVIEPSLARDAVAGLADDGLLLLNAPEAPAGLTRARVVSVPADELAAASGLRFANIVMAGAVAGAIGAPPLAPLQDAAVELLGKKISPDAVREAVAKGFAWTN